jgi:signal transduction histidine kinase
MQKEFVNIAAHEIRTPIQPILGLTVALRSKMKDTEQLQVLDAVIRNEKIAAAQRIYLILQKLNVIHYCLVQFN